MQKTLPSTFLLALLLCGASGTLSAFASDQKAPPLSAVLHFAASERVIGNSAIVPLSTQVRDLAVLPIVNTGSGLDLNIDVIGYFAPAPSPAPVQEH